LAGVEVPHFEACTDRQVPQKRNAFELNQRAGINATTKFERPGIALPFHVYTATPRCRRAKVGVPTSERQPRLKSYTINANGSLTPISQSLPTFGNGNCWKVITPNGKWVYVDNAGTLTVAGFSIAANGALAPVGGTILAALADDRCNLRSSLHSYYQAIAGSPTIPSGHKLVQIRS
jgi:6-phosphogluconolactonase (cycloisomerase 2 family)